jgi:anti-anti-sigma factor
VSESGRARPVRVEWLWEECTERTASGFNRLGSAIERSGAKRVILDMSKCKYMSVGGLRLLLEWHGLLARDGVTVRVGGLKETIRNVFRLARVDWIIAD